jgi:hypothetical protein
MVKGVGVDYFNAFWNKFITENRMTKQQTNLPLYSPNNDKNEVHEKGEMILPLFSYE